MQVDFRHVLARVGAGRAEKDRHHLVNRRAGRVGQGAIAHLAVLHFALMGGTERGAQKFPCARAADPYNGDAALAGWCGDGGNRVVLSFVTH